MLLLLAAWSHGSPTAIGQLLSNSPDQPEANSLTVLLNILTAPEEPNADNLELLCEQAERAISLGREIRFRVEKSDWKQSLRGLCTQIDFP